MASRELKVEIIGDSRSLEKALGRAADSSSKFGSAMSKTAKVVGLAFVAAGAAVTAGFIYTLKRGFDELADSQKVMAQTQAVLKSTGGVANVTAKEVAALAESQSKLTGIDDELIQANENLLLTFKNVHNEVGKGNDIFNRATKASLDLSVAGFGSLDSTAKQLGKALNDPVKGMTALGRAGVTFTEGQKETIKSLVESGKTLEAQKLILKEVETQVGGSAEAYGKTLPGQLAKARNAFDEIAGKVAAKFLPALTAALDWVNSNWPKIEAIMETVADGIGSAMSAVADAVKRNFDTIKSVGTAAFEGLKSTVQAVGNFLQSDFGQKVAAAALATVALSKAFFAVRAGVAVAQVALAGLTKNPFFLALIPLGIAVGVFAQRFISAKIEASNLAAALDRAASSGDLLKASLDRLNESETQVESAKIALISATRQLETAEKNWHTAVATSKKGSDERKSAWLEYRAALNTVEFAQDRVTAATKEHTDAEKDRKGELTGGITQIQTMTGSMQGLERGYLPAITQGKSFIENMRSLASQSRDTAREAESLGDAAGVRAARKVSILAGVAVDLTKKLGGVPTFKEIIAEAKVRGLDKFIAGTAKIPKAADRAKDETKAALDRIPQAMPAIAAEAGAQSAGIGSAITTGIPTGFDFGGVLDVLRTGIRNMIQQAKQNLGSTAEEYAGKHLGKPMGQGIVNQLAQALADGTPSTKDKARKFIGEATNILDAVRAKGYDLGNKQVQAVIDGILGKTPSLKQQIMTAIDEANAAAEQRIRDAKVALKEAWASVWSEVAQAGLDAIAAKFEGWVPPSTLKLAAMDLQEQQAALAQAITDSDTAMAAAVSSAQQYGDELAQLANASALLASGAGMDAVVDALPAALEAQLVGLSPEEAAKKIEEWRAATQQKLDEANAAIIKAKADHEAAIRAQLRFDLQEAAKIEQQEHDKKVKTEQDNFIEDLKRLRKQQREQHMTWKEAQDGIIKLFKKYGVDYHKAGAALGESFAEGIKDGLAAVGSAVDELAEAIAKKLKGRSPPPEGPLRDIDRWGVRLVKAFLSGFNANLINKELNKIKVPDTFQRPPMLEGLSQWTEQSFGGVAEPGGSPFASMGIPPGVNSSLYQFAATLALAAGKFDEFVEDMWKGRTNARILDLLFQNRTRWNWAQFPPWIASILNTMRDLGLSGAEAAPMYGLARGGIITSPTRALIGEAGPEAVVPLSRYRGGMGGKVVVNIGTVVGTPTRAIADAWATEIDSALARKRGRTGALALD